MQEVKALLVFCEGSHDVAFVQQIFKLCLGFKTVEWKFSEYPAPFQDLFKTSVQNHAAKDLSLDMARKFFLPDCVLKKEDYLVLIFNAGGSEQTDKVKLLLKNFLALLAQSAIFPNDATAIVSEAYYLFLYDADYIGTTALFNKIKHDFSSIEDEPRWSFSDWNFLDNNPLGAIAENKAAYIWCTNLQNGTLEDIILPMFETDQEKIIKKATDFIDSDIFVWETNNSNLKHQVAEIAKRKKAIMTCAGQRKKTGGSMNVIISQSKLISKNTFLNDTNVKAFSDFIKIFLMI